MADLVWAGCVVPDDLLYDVDDHVWVRIEGPDVVLGMTDVAQAMGGRIVQITWKRTGRSYARGRALAVIESAKWVGPFPTPISGELVEVNEAGFTADVAIANRDPYGAGWLARLRPDDLSAERDHLVGGAAALEYYRGFTAEHNITCIRCAD
jgi:glycine cleavage system H protein